MAADRDVLFTEHHSRLFRYLCRTVGHAKTARDLTQDVLLRVSRTAIPAATNGEVNAWLFRIARNVALAMRRSGRQT
jgi:DNA-directed RNA polymerase specialized sigma24 family protein